MRVRLMRAAGVLVAALLVAPLGVGVAGATIVTESEPTSAVVSDDGTAQEDGATVSAEGAAAGDSAGKGAAAGSDDAGADGSSEGAPTGTADAEKAALPTPSATAGVPGTAPAAGTPEVDAIELMAFIRVPPYWNSRGAYTTYVHIQDVVGLVGGAAMYSGANGDMDELVFEYQVNGGAWVVEVPAADMSPQVPGLIEGDNTVAVRATYTTPSAVVVVDEQVFDIRVLTQAESVAVGLAEARMVTMDGGGQILLSAPMRSLGADELVDFHVFQGGVLVASRVFRAAADGSLEASFIIPSSWVGDYLVQAQGESGFRFEWLLVRVQPAAVVTSTDPPTATLAGSPTAPTSSATATPPPATSALAPRLAATGADPTLRIVAAVVAVLLGAGAVVGVHRIRGRRTGEPVT